MRISKTQIVSGITDYIRNEILPKMENDRAMQIIFTVAVNAACANGKLIDTIFDNSAVRSMLDDDGSGTYEISGILDSVRGAVSQYGGFPVTIPAIPLVSPREITLRLTGDDIDAIRRRIEGASSNE